MRHTLSEKILNSLNRGQKRLSAEAIAHLSDYVQSQLLPDQSFMNKAGKSDLYYTLFGWMLCWILQIKLDASKMKAYLDSQNENNLDLIHYACLKRCAMVYLLFTKGKVGIGIQRIKHQKIKDIHNFDHVPNNDINAPYAQYIWLSLLEDTGNKLPKKEHVAELLAQYKTNDGGYVNNINDTTATTNATVAALAVLGQLHGFSPNESLYYLRNIQKNNGGFSATESSPIPDILSTATALFMLHCYSIAPKHNAENFIEAHWLESGGFSATLADNKSDVEYCFYGLLALSCC